MEDLFRDLRQAKARQSTTNIEILDLEEQIRDLLEMVDECREALKRARQRTADNGVQERAAERLQGVGATLSGEDAATWRRFESWWDEQEFAVVDIADALIVYTGWHPHEDAPALRRIIAGALGALPRSKVTVLQSRNRA